MALAVVVDSLDAIPETLREHYVKSDDGKFRLDGVEDTGVLKRSLENAKRERKEAKDALDEFKGVDPAEYARLKQEASDRELASATKKGEFEKLKEQMVGKHQQELGDKDKTLSGMRAALESYLIDSEATRELAEVKGAPTLMLPHVRAQVKVIEEEGKFVARVVDKDGNPRIGDASGEPMSIKQLVAEMRASEAFGRAFEASGASGSGAPSGGAGGTPGKKQYRLAEFNAMSALARAAAMAAGATITD